MRNSSKVFVEEVESFMSDRDVHTAEALSIYFEEVVEIFYSAIDAYGERVNKNRLGCFVAEVNKLQETYKSTVLDKVNEYVSSSLDEFKDRLNSYAEEIAAYVKPVVETYVKCAKSEETARCFKAFMKVK